MAKEVLFSENARKRILSGVNVLAESVKVTLGAEDPVRNGAVPVGNLPHRKAVLRVHTALRKKSRTHA